MYFDQELYNDTINACIVGNLLIKTLSGETRILLLNSDIYKILRDKTSLCEKKVDCKFCNLVSSPLKNLE